MSRLAANLIAYSKYAPKFSPQSVVSVSRRDLAAADRTFRRAERATLTAERRVLLRAGNNVRTMSIAALKGRKSKRTGLPAMQPLDKAWRVLLHPDKPMGGKLADKGLWRITMPNRHARDVDIVPGMQPHLERWEFGDGGERAAVLNSRIAFYRDTPKGRAIYHGSLAKRGYPPHVSQLPPVRQMPRRNFRDGVAAYADAHMGEWFEKIWDTYQRRG